MLTPENSDNAPKGKPLAPQPKWFRRALALALILGVTPAFAADPDNGERLARRWCSPCHVVASDQTGPTGEAPPFATIAAKPDFDTAKLAFLLDPHPKMPNMQLSRTEAADLAAYIATLISPAPVRLPPPYNPACLVQRCWYCACRTVDAGGPPWTARLLISTLSTTASY